MKHVTEVGVLSVCISDHLLIYLIKKKGQNCIRREVVEIRSMRRYNVTSLEHLIRTDRRWLEFGNDELSVNELWDIMYNIFLDAVNI